MRKKILAMLLAICMAASTLPISYATENEVTTTETVVEDAPVEGEEFETLEEAAEEVLGAEEDAQADASGEEAQSVASFMAVAADDETAVAAASATETVVTDEAEFIAAMENSLNSTSVYIKLDADITFDIGTYGNYLANGSFEGTLDGNGHTLTIVNNTTTLRMLIKTLGDAAVVKDLNVKYEGTQVSQLFYQVSSDPDGDNAVLFDNVDILDNEEMIYELSANMSPYGCFIFDDFTMTNCDNYEQFNGGEYCGIFVGGYQNNPDDTITFTNCNNYGDLNGEYVAMFMGNSNNGTTADITLTNCKNYGTITGTGGAAVFAVNGNEYSTLNAEYPISDINGTYTDEYGQTYTGVIETIVSADITGTIAEDGTITIANNDTDTSAVTYGVRMQGYSSGTNGEGTWLIGILATADSLDEFNAMGVRYGKIIDSRTFATKFSDEETYVPYWDVECEFGIENLEYEIAVIDNVLYYVITIENPRNDYDYRINEYPATTVRAYNENGTLVASVTTTASEITTPDIVCTINDAAFFGTLAEAVAAAEDGDVIDLLGNTIAEATKWTNVLEGKSDITIQNGTFSNALSITDEIDGLTLKNLTFTAGANLDGDAGSGTALYLQGDSASALMDNVVIDNCTFTYAGGATTSVNAITTSSTGMGDVTIQNCTFENFASVYHNPSVGGSIVHDNNTYTNVANGIMAVGQTGVTVTNCTFENSNGVCIRTNWSNVETCESVIIFKNKFIDVPTYAVSTQFNSTAVTGFAGEIDLRYNYFDGADDPTSLFAFGEGTTYTLYPYYADADLTTLVYEDASTTVEGVAEEMLSDVDSLTTDAEINEAALVVALADTTTMIAADETLIEAINALDALFVAANDANLDIEVSVGVAEGADIDNNDLIDVTAVSGLALAVYGNGSYIEEDTTLTLAVEQIEVEDENADFTFTAVPYVTVGTDGTSTKIDNDDLNAPVTFLVYLPDTFEYDYAEVEHVKSDDTSEFMTLPVLEDETGRYIQITVTEFSTFLVSGYTVSTSTSVRNTYYDIDVEDTDNGEVTVSLTRAVEGKTITITAIPDEGYEIDDVIVLDEGDDEIDVDDEGDGEYTFEMPDEDVTIEATFVAIDEDEDDDTIAFLDVDADAYYYDAVLWAVEEGITNGMTEYLFAPDTVCTRAQAVTFLWNAAGNPTVFIENPFADVAEDAWYYDAVLWAVSEGITSGTTETTFAPDSTCTRAQIVTFLWNAAGNSVVDFAMDFDDVAADSWYAEAVRWAVSEEITTGMTATEFAPSTNCTRGQIVTFLYRYLGE